jgi:uncharacterized protein YcsI (UPF0317 family)
LGGGIVGPDGGMKADFDQVEMIVKEFKFRPEYLALQRNVGKPIPLVDTVEYKPAIVMYASSSYGNCPI